MSKGGTTSGSTEIPAWLENAAIENINKARDVSQIGYTPYYGPDVAAFSPMQQQSMQSTGNAASAFGLAPQGFDAMAGMPQAQTFAGGMQGYSSAPLYEQSLDKLFANAPAQYNAMNNMFIDPFTGARPQGNYAASPTQVSQMSSGNGGGYVSPTPTPDFTPALDGGTGYWSGGERTATQTNDMTDPEFEAYVLAHGLPQADQYTTGDAIGGLIGNMADSTLIGRLYEGVTGNPLGGGSFNAPVSGLNNSDVYNSRFGGITGYEQANARAQADQAASISRAKADEQAARQRSIDIAIAQEDAIAAGLLENLNLSAVTTPYRAPVVTQSTVNSSGDGRGARQRDRNSSGGGYGGGGDSYDPSGRF